MKTNHEKIKDLERSVKVLRKEVKWDMAKLAGLMIILSILIEILL